MALNPSAELLQREEAKHSVLAAAHKVLANLVRLAEEFQILQDGASEEILRDVDQAKLLAEVSSLGLSLIDSDAKVRKEGCYACKALSLPEEKHAVLHLTHKYLGAQHRERRLSLEKDNNKKSKASWTEASDLVDNLQEELLDAIREEASPELCGDKVVMLQVLSVLCVFESLSPELRNDLEVFFVALPMDDEAWTHAGDAVHRTLVTDREKTVQAVKTNGCVLEFLGPELQDDEEIVRIAVASRSDALQFASDRLRADRNFVRSALETEAEPTNWLRGTVFDYAGPDLQADKEFVLFAVQRFGSLAAASKDLRLDRDVVLTAMKNQNECDREAHDFNLLESVDNKFRSDAEIVLEAVRFDGASMKFASNRFKNDKDFVVKAVRVAPTGQKRLCYNKAGSTVHSAVSWPAFKEVANSALAVEGEEAPILTVALSHAAAADDDAMAADQIRCEASLMSGTSFEVYLDRLHSTLEDLAQKLVAGLPSDSKAAGRVFIHFMAPEDSGNSHEDAPPVTPWDWARPLSDFLPPPTRGSADGPRPAKKPRI